MVFVLEIKNYESVKIVRMASLNNISLDTSLGAEKTSVRWTRGLISIWSLDGNTEHTSPEAYISFNEWKSDQASKIHSVYSLGVDCGQALVQGPGFNFPIQSARMQYI